MQIPNFLKRIALIFTLFILVPLVIELLFFTLNNLKQENHRFIGLEHEEVESTIDKVASDRYEGTYIQNEVPGESMIPIEETHLTQQYINLLPLQQGVSATRFELLTNDNKVSTSMVYTEDNYGRRITYDLEEDLMTKNKHVIFFGCSFTAGSGVEDWQTLPSYTAYNTYGYNIYNYGVGGSGSSKMLRVLEERDLSLEVNEHEGIAIYIFISDHIRRNIGDMRWSNLNENLDYYYLDGDQNAISGGTFITGRYLTTKFYQTLYNTNVSKYFRLNFPQTTESDLLLTAKIIEKSKQRYEEKFQGKFYVLFHPYEDPGISYQDTLKLKDLLKQMGIVIIDLPSVELNEENVEKFLLEDLHPNSFANQALAKELVTYLDL